MDSIIDIIETALAKAGFKILDGDSDTVFIRNQKNNHDYEIRVTEVARGSKMKISIVRTGKKTSYQTRKTPGAVTQCRLLTRTAIDAFLCRKLKT